MIRAWIVRSGGFFAREFAREIDAQLWLAAEVAQGVDDWGVGR